MHRDDNISKLFQNSQHNLEERPSSRAWQRLEQRLDAKKAQHRRLIYRYVSTVAAVIAVLAMITAISVFDFPQNKEMANQTTTETPTIALNNNDSKRLEEFKKTEGIDKSVSELLEEQEVENEEEGVDIYVEEEDYKSNVKEQIAQHIPKPKPSPATKRVEPIIKEVPTLEEEKIVEDEAVFSESDAIVEEAVEVSAPAPVVKPQSTPKNDWNKGKIKDKIAAKKKKEAARAKTRKSQTTRTTSKVELDKMTGSAMLNQMEPQPKVNLSTITLADFKWLEGEWEDTKKSDGTSSYEKWKKKGKNTLVGEGFLSGSDGNKFFTETMKIRKKNGNIYYYTQLEKDGDLIKFKLIQFDGSMAIFENKEISFPQQILLQKKGSSTFTTIFQNTQDMSSVQEKQLKYRNNISRERATRVMKRSASSY